MKVINGTSLGFVFCKSAQGGHHLSMQIVLRFSLYYTFTPLSLDLFYHYLITLLQGHMAKHATAL